MCTVDWKLLLEFLKVLLSWPPIGLVITLVVLFRFQSSIEDLIRRLTKGKLLGQEFEATQHSTVNLDATNRLPDRSTHESSKEGDNAQSQDILKFVKNSPEEAVRHIQTLTFQYNVERIFNQIYGTQLNLLEHLVSRCGQPAKLSELAHYHAEHQRMAGTAVYQIEPYINFLVSSGLLTATNDPSTSTEYTISTMGVKFLSYVKAMYPHWKHQRMF